MSTAAKLADLRSRLDKAQDPGSERSRKKRDEAGRTTPRQRIDALLDEGTYLCSMSTMHRILRAHGAAGERRAQATHPTRTKPELVATRAGQVWSWDITKLRGPDRGVYYDLYVVIDIFSRYIVGWTVAAREDAQGLLDADPELSDHPQLRETITDWLDAEQAAYLEKG